MPSSSSVVSLPFQFSPHREYRFAGGDGLTLCARRMVCTPASERPNVHLTLLNEAFHGAGDVFDRHVGVDAVLIEQIDDLS